MMPQNPHIRRSQIPDGIDPQFLQRVFRGFPHKQQFRYGKRPHLLGNLLRKQRVDPVGLLEIRGHFCQQLIAGDSDIHREPQFFFDAVFEPVRKCHRFSQQPLHACHIHKRLINAVFFHIRCVFSQDIHKLF